jgi:hypothetical protein
MVLDTVRLPESLARHTYSDKITGRNRSITDLAIMTSPQWRPLQDDTGFGDFQWAIDTYRERDCMRAGQLVCKNRSQKSSSKRSLLLTDHLC